MYLDCLISKRHIYLLIIMFCRDFKAVLVFVRQDTSLVIIPLTLRNFFCWTIQSTKSNSVWFVMLSEASATAMIIAENNNFDKLKQFSTKICASTTCWSWFDGNNSKRNCSEPDGLKKIMHANCEAKEDPRRLGYFPFPIVKLSLTWNVIELKGLLC